MRGLCVHEVRAQRALASSRSDDGIHDGSGGSFERPQGETPIKHIITTVAAGSIAALLATSTSFAADTMSAKDKCEPAISVNGKRTPVIDGLPEGTCSFVRTQIIKGRDCFSGFAFAEPADEDARRKFGVGKGQEMWHFRCARPDHPKIPRTAANTQ